MQYLAIIVLAFAPGIFWLWMVYRRDKYRPEPRALVVRTFLWGMLVALPVALLESLLTYIAVPDVFSLTDTGTLPLVTAAYISFVVAGMTEEMGKYIVVRKTVYNSLYFDEPMDGLVYASAAALGFASLENFGYILTFGWDVILIRGPFSTLAHVLFAIMWGYPLGLSKIREGGRRWLVWSGLVVSMIAHGLFDFLIFSESTYSLLVIPLFLGAGLAFILMLRHARRQSPYKTMVGELQLACPSCGSRVPYYGQYCTKCGEPLAGAKGSGTVYCGQCGALLNKDAQYCTSCGSRLLRKSPRH